MLHIAPLLKTTWSSSSPVKHWQAPHCSTTPLLFNIIIIIYYQQVTYVFVIFYANIKTTWSKWIFSVNQVKYWPHDAPHSDVPTWSNSNNQLISNMSLSSEYFSAKYNLHSFSDGNSHSLPPLAILLGCSKGICFLNCGINFLGPQFQ